MKTEYFLNDQQKRLFYCFCRAVTFELLMMSILLALTPWPFFNFMKTGLVMSEIFFIHKRYVRARFQTEVTRSTFTGFCFFSNLHPTILHERVSCSRVSPALNYINDRSCHTFKFVFATGILWK